MGFLNDLLTVYQFVAFFRDENVEAVGDCHAAHLRALAECLAEHVAEVDHSDLASRHARDVHRGHAAAVGDADFDFLVVQLVVAQALAERFPCSR